MWETTRGYVEVRDNRATFHTPHGGRWIGCNHDVSVPPTTAAGWYRCSASWSGSSGHWYVTLGRKVDPAKEAARLRKLSEGHAEARTKSPGIAGYVHMETMATESLRARRQVQRHFADLLDHAANV